MQSPGLMSSAWIWEHVQVNDITVNLCHALRHPDVANKDNKEGKTRLLMITPPLQFGPTLVPLSEPHRAWAEPLKKQKRCLVRKLGGRNATSSPCYVHHLHLLVRAPLQRSLVSLVGPAIAFACASHPLHFVIAFCLLRSSPCAG